MTFFRSELSQSLSQHKLLSAQQAQTAGENSRRRKEQFDSGLKSAMSALASRKAEESRFIRETLRSSVAASRSMRRDEVKHKRWQAREAAPFALDASSSTIIDVPAALVTRVKTAKR